MSLQSSAQIPLIPIETVDAVGALDELELSILDVRFGQWLQLMQPSTNPEHALLASWLSKQVSQGHTCVSLDQLPSPIKHLQHSAAAMPWVHGNASPLVLMQHRLYLRRHWQAEQTIAHCIAKRLQTAEQMDATLEARLKQQLHLLFDLDSSTAQPNWQAIACALASRAMLTVITGGPGTGKTTTVVRLLALLQSSQNAPLHLALTAPTGKAAARLGDSMAQAIGQLPAHLQPLMQAHAQVKATTLHQLLQVGHAANRSSQAALAFDVVVVDEASMIDLEMMALLLSQLPTSTRLILLGDKDQLASVEAGAVMAQLCAHAEQGLYDAQTVDWIGRMTSCDIGPWKAPLTHDLFSPALLARQTVMLRKSHRFHADSAIGQWAQAVNTGHIQTVQRLWQQTPAWSAHSTAEVQHAPCGESTSRPSQWLAPVVRHGWRALRQQLHVHTGAWSDAQALDAMKALGQFQVLCAQRQGPWGVQTLNQHMTQAMGMATDSDWYAGRPVMVTRNDRGLGLMNGDVGLCLPSRHAMSGEPRLKVAFITGQGCIRWVLPKSCLLNLMLLFWMWVQAVDFRVFR
jgi:exodeoxyribonuclease V alpha subunit